ncbi:hypothetical protein [Bacillus cereus group sp. BfR-BA-01380]|uniref:hypothetical protein n=1 Tax=Bacillus cereus group sp. BfR-BA-01380 TaxID=2920324 RepID=UPI001F5978C0|nr:hypothetical protein [Bacillus cereus group sp. BfR-BA-01380]
MLDSNTEKKGTLKEYFYYEGWYNDSPWLIDDVSLTIKQLKTFDIDNIKESSSMRNTLIEVIKEILSFLEQNSSEDIYRI